MSRIRIGTCLRPAEAALMRSMLAAHGIHAVVGSELAGLGGGSLTADLWVAEQDRDDAARLLGADHRAGEVDGGDTDADTDADTDDDTRAVLPHHLEQRRRTGIALLLGCCLTFGSAHVFTHARLRGIALAALELVGLLQVHAGKSAGKVLVIAAIAADLIGALWRIRARTTLPAARVLRG